MDESLFEIIKTLIQDISDVALELDIQNEILGLAHKRESEKKYPAKINVKDTVIIEEYFDLSSKLRNKEFGKSIVFLTSNYKDYSDEENKNIIHNDMKSEFDRFDIEYCRNWHHAARALGLK